MRVRWSLFAPNAYVSFPVFGWRRVRAPCASVCSLGRTPPTKRVFLHAYMYVTYVQYYIPIVHVYIRYSITEVFICMICTFREMCIHTTQELVDLRRCQHPDNVSRRDRHFSSHYSPSSFSLPEPRSPPLTPTHP